LPSVPMIAFGAKYSARTALPTHTTTSTLCVCNNSVATV
jgi:hypothetical protein